MPNYTNIPDKTIRKLGLRDAFVLCLVYRHQRRREGKFTAGVDKKARSLKISPNTLRAALHRLRRDDYIHDLTPNIRNVPHDYVLTQTGLTLATENWSPKSGDQELDTKDRTPITGDEEYSPSSTPSKSTKGKNTKKRSSSTTATGQMTLVKEENLHNLGSLDIQEQKRLDTLGILNIKQKSSDHCPTVAQERTPAEVLMFYDEGGAIAANLERWAEAWQNKADIRDKPTLIWWKICELQPPPEPETEPEGVPAWLKGVALT